MGKKSKRFEIRLSEEEYSIVEGKGLGLGISMGEYIRRCILGEAIGEVVLKSNIDELPPPSYQLGQIVSWNRPILNNEEDRLKKLEAVRMIPLDKISGSLYEDLEHDPEFIDVFARVDDGEVYMTKEI